MHAYMKGFHHHDRASWWHANYVCVFMHMHSCSWLLTVVWRSESAQTSAHMYMCTCTHISWHQQVGNSRVAVIPSGYISFCFCNACGYTCWPSAVIPSGYIALWKLAVITVLGPASVIPKGYNRYLFFMANQITIGYNRLNMGCTCLHVFTCAYLCACSFACLHTFVYV